MGKFVEIYLSNFGNISQSLVELIPHS